jgi:hypothetical protein
MAWLHAAFNVFIAHGTVTFVRPIVSLSCQQGSYGLYTPAAAEANAENIMPPGLFTAVTLVRDGTAVDARLPKSSQKFAGNGLVALPTTLMRMGTADQSPDAAPDRDGALFVLSFTPNAVGGYNIIAMDSVELLMAGQKDIGVLYGVLSRSSSNGRSWTGEAG